MCYRKYFSLEHRNLIIHLGKKCFINNLSTSKKPAAGKNVEINFLLKSFTRNIAKLKIIEKFERNDWGSFPVIRSWLQLFLRFGYHCQKIRHDHVKGKSKRSRDFSRRNCFYPNYCEERLDRDLKRCLNNWPSAIHRPKPNKMKVASKEESNIVCSSSVNTILSKSPT